MHWLKSFPAYFIGSVLLGYSFLAALWVMKPLGNHWSAGVVLILGVILSQLFWPLFIYGRRKFKKRGVLLLFAAPLPAALTLFLAGSWIPILIGLGRESHRGSVDFLIVLLCLCALAGLYVRSRRKRKPQHEGLINLEGQRLYR